MIFVTTNAGKFEEMRRELRGIVSLKQLPIPYPEIQSDDLEEIASFGAKFCSRMLGKDVIVEDSGLFIDSLNGFPGPYSSYVFHKIGCDGILKLMDGIKERGAEFRSVIAFCTPHGEPITFSGRVRGRIATERRGEKGFGFDPIFLYRGRTFAEMSVEEKNAVSHRGRAARKLRKWLQKRRQNNSCR